MQPCWPLTCNPADMVLAPLPVVGDVALAATGAYLALDWTYQHWTPFRDVANDVGHATVKEIGRAHV